MATAEDPISLECGICYELMEKTAKCKTGHTICGTCARKVNKRCPFCRADMTKERNREIEDLVAAKVAARKPAKKQTKKETDKKKKARKSSDSMVGLEFLLDLSLEGYCSDCMEELMEDVEIYYHAMEFLDHL